MLQRQPQIFRLEGPTKLKFMQDLSDRAQRLKFISELLASFAQHRVAQ
ncbi:Transcription-repair-coupling factor [Yersinia frederiksenii ATCC 33641]|nr:Transcription-repair-coupling factor [Yersinia frederiksenii ATCC 33641]